MEQVLKARLENVRKTEIGPLIELNIYNGDKLEYGAVDLSSPATEWNAELLLRVLLAPLA